MLNIPLDEKFLATVCGKSKGQLTASVFHVDFGSIADRSRSAMRFRWIGMD
jgi:hypothetical protein